MGIRRNLINDTNLDTLGLTGQIGFPVSHPALRSVLFFLFGGSMNTTEINQLAEEILENKFFYTLRLSEEVAEQAERIESELKECSLYSETKKSLAEASVEAIENHLRIVLGSIEDIQNLILNNGE